MIRAPILHLVDYRMVTRGTTGEARREAIREVLAYQLAANVNAEAAALERRAKALVKHALAEASRHGA